MRTKRIKDFSNYLIDEKGNVFSTKTNKQITPGINQYGYVLYCLIDDNNVKRTVYAHRAVYQTFVGNIIEGYEINHIDNDKRNNCITNLNLLTHKENCNYLKEDRLNYYFKVIDKYNNIDYAYSVSDLSQMIGVSKNTIYVKFKKSYCNTINEYYIEKIKKNGD